MTIASSLGGVISALIAAVLSLLGVPAPRPAPPAPDAGVPMPGATVIRRDGAVLSFQRAARPRTGSVAARIRPAGAAAPGGSRLDLDADGLDEIVIGAYVLGGGYSVIVEYSTLPYRDYLSAPITSPTRPNFGDVLTSGDFNGDGYADLAVSNQGEFVPGCASADCAFAGAVWIFYGSATGLDPGTVMHINQNVTGVPDDMEGYDMFGAGVAAGDINGDGYDEIAIGAPGESVGAAEGWAGSATVLFGGSTGLSTAGPVALTQDSDGVPDDAEVYDSFGRGVAIGDITGDGYADLAVGSPGEGISKDCLSCEQGLIVLIPGTASGPATTGVTMLHGATDVPVSTLGEHLVMADIDQDGRDDLIAATPRSSGGSITFVPGTPTGLSLPGVRVINEDTPGVPSEWVCCQTNGNGEEFGFAVATGEVTGDGYPDVLVTNIGQDVAAAMDAGSAILIPGSAAGLTGAGSVMITQNPPAQPAGRKPQPGLPYRDVAETGDYLGYSAAIADLDGVGPAELLLATDWEVNPGEDPNFSSGLLMAARYQASTPRRGQTAAIPGKLVALMSWPGAAFNDLGITVYRMGSSMLHS